MNRLLDIGISLLALLVLFPFLIVIFFLGLADTGSPIFQQIRVGWNQRPFTLIKFRTMKRETLSVATHLADPQAVTPIAAPPRSLSGSELVAARWRLPQCPRGAEDLGACLWRRNPLDRCIWTVKVLTHWCLHLNSSQTSKSCQT